MILNDILFIIGVIIYLALKDGYIYGKRLWQLSRKMAHKRKMAFEERIRGIIEPKLPPEL